MKNNIRVAVCVLCKAIIACTFVWFTLVLASMTYLWQDTIPPVVLGGNKIEQVPAGEGAKFEIEIVKVKRFCDLRVNTQLLDSEGQPHAKLAERFISSEMLEDALAASPGRFRAELPIPKKTAKGKLKITFRLAFSCNSLQETMPIKMTYKMETEVL